MEEFPVLYILMRTDLPSMNPGKAMAQASHASNAFVHMMDTGDKEYLGEKLSKSDELFNKWTNETSQGFGTVLVLGVTEAQMRTANLVADKLGFVADIVTDPTYPAFLDKEAVNIDDVRWTSPCIPAGDKTVTFRMEDTCGFIFGDKNDPMLSAVVGNFKLHP